MVILDTASVETSGQTDGVSSQPRLGFRGKTGVNLRVDAGILGMGYILY